jgi:hypothetical protein
MGLGKFFKKLMGDKSPKRESSTPSLRRNLPDSLYLPNSHTPKLSPTREASKTGSKDSAAMAQITTQTSQAVQALQDFALQVLKVKCHRCSTPLLRNFSAKAYVRDWSITATSRDGASICVATCPSCNSETCVGCGEKPVYNAPKSVREYDLSWCCTSGRLFGIWVLLGRYDDVELQLQGKAKEDLEKQKKEEELKQWRNQQMSSFGPKGFGFPGGFGTQPLGPTLGTVVKKPPVKGVGYDDDEKVHNYGPINLYFDGPGRPPGLLAQAVHFDQQDSKTDNLTCLILSLVTVLLPNGARRNLPPELKAMIEVSLILDKVAELLRNDSLDNVTRRYELYSAAMKFTARLACHPELSCLVNEARFSKRRTAGLQAVSEAAMNKAATDVLIPGDEQLSSIGKGLGNLVQQAHIVLRAGKSGAFQADGGQAMLDICKEIIELHNQLATQSSAVESKLKQTETVEECYMQYCKGHCLTWDDSVFDLIHGNLRAGAKRTTHFSGGRAKKLMTEIATMSTSLPPGVFVKVGESRTDVMKALIMGPKDSPYGYGMFEYVNHEVRLGGVVTDLVSDSTSSVQASIQRSRPRFSLARVVVYRLGYTSIRISILMVKVR